MRETVRSLDIAARSIVETQAHAGTVAGVIAERALDHHWQGLYQYAAIRTGAETAFRLLEQLAQAVESAQQEAQEAADDAPSPQAVLYKRLRGMLSRESPSRLSPDANAWWAPQDNAFRRGLCDVRRTLGFEEAEIVELRFARRLVAASASRTSAAANSSGATGSSSRISSAGTPFCPASYSRASARSRAA